MDFVAKYDERYDKSPIFGAFAELCRLSAVEVTIGIIGTLTAFLYWIANIFDIDQFLFSTDIKLDIFDYVDLITFIIMLLAVVSGICGLVSASRQTERALWSHLFSAAFCLFLLGGLTVLAVVGLVRASADYTLLDSDVARDRPKPSQLLDDIIFLSGVVIFSTILFGIFSASTAYAYICLRENTSRS